MPTNKSAQTPLQCDSVVHEINEGDLSHPEAVCHAVDSFGRLRLAPLCVV